MVGVGRFSQVASNGVCIKKATVVAIGWALEVSEAGVKLKRLGRSRVSSQWVPFVCQGFVSHRCQIKVFELERERASRIEEVLYVKTLVRDAL